MRPLSSVPALKTQTATAPSVRPKRGRPLAVRCSTCEKIRCSCSIPLCSQCRLSCDACLGNFQGLSGWRPRPAQGSQAYVHVLKSILRLASPDVVVLPRQRWRASCYRRLGEPRSAIRVIESCTHLRRSHERCAMSTKLDMTVLMLTKTGSSQLMHVSFFHRAPRCHPSHMSSMASSRLRTILLVTSLQTDPPPPPPPRHFVT